MAMNDSSSTPHIWLSADKELAQMVQDGVGANLIENDLEENRALVELWLAGEKMDGCLRSSIGKRNPHSPNGWTAYPRTRGMIRRTIYRGSLYQCAVARDCFWLLREPFARHGYGSRPGEQRKGFFLTREEDIWVRLSGESPTRKFFNSIILRLVEQGILKPRKEQKAKGQTILREKPIPGLEMQARLNERLEDLYNRLEGIEQLLSERIPENLLDALSAMSKTLCGVHSGLGDLWNKLPEEKASHILIEAGNVSAIDALGGSLLCEPPAPGNTKEIVVDLGCDAL